jgi:hypothetical protein
MNSVAQILNSDSNWTERRCAESCYTRNVNGAGWYLICCLDDNFSVGFNWLLCEIIVAKHIVIVIIIVCHDAGQAE